MTYLQIIIFTGLLESCMMITKREELLLRDPSEWPGHLEPFGSQQPTGKVEELNQWPDPATFFREYVDKNKPALFKGLAKLSPGYEKFEDDFFRNAPGADKTIIYAEPELKENRTKKGFEISMQDFIDRYHKETLYMVNLLPSQYTPEVRMPAPLRCESTKELMSSQVTWFSGGGTKSVLHNDDVDNINCLFRGSKDLWFIEYNKNKNYVPIDMVQGGYSSLDVDKVNYTQFPELRKVDKYYKATMEQGDCLFIPYHWFHQVNSVANDKKMNLAVNVWFKHVVGHVPEGCDFPESEATLDKYTFPDDMAEQESRESDVDHFARYIPKGKYINLKIFSKFLRKDRMVNPEGIQVEDADIRDVCEELFNVLDVNKDSKLSRRDFAALKSLEESQREEMDNLLNKHVASVENVIEDLVEDTKQSEMSASQSASKTEDSEDPEDSDELVKEEL